MGYHPSRLPSPDCLQARHGGRSTTTRATGALRPTLARSACWMPQASVGPCETLLCAVDFPPPSPSSPRVLSRARLQRSGRLHRPRRRERVLPDAGRPGRQPHGGDLLRHRRPQRDQRVPLHWQLAERACGVALQRSQCLRATAVMGGGGGSRGGRCQRGTRRLAVASSPLHLLVVASSTLLPTALGAAPLCTTAAAGHQHHRGRDVQRRVD